MMEEEIRPESLFNDYLALAQERYKNLFFIITASLYSLSSMW